VHPKFGSGIIVDAEPGQRCRVQVNFGNLA